jgi:hypothetical protein
MELNLHGEPRMVDGIVALEQALMEARWPSASCG